jgi:hypothetical protein
MATGSPSSVEDIPLGDPPSLRSGGALNASQVWLDGDVLACACPDCSAPMTIRLWLRLAQCRMCGTEVELTEEQERAAQELLARREAGIRPSPPPPKPSPVKPPTWSHHVAPPPSAPPAPPPRPEPPPLVAVPVIEPPPLPTLVAVPVGADEPVVAPVESRYRRVSRRLLDFVFSCLISLLVHMTLVIILGLWMYRIPHSEALVLQATVKPQQTGPLGAESTVRVQRDAPPTPSPVVPPDEVVRRQFVMHARRPDLQALSDKLVISPKLQAPNFFDLGHVEPGTMFAGRDPRVRAQLLKQEGGTDQTERAVAMGLKWLAAHQFADGRWSLDQFSAAGECRGRCGDHGIQSDTAATALGVLPFLGAGHTHRYGDYREVVKPAIEWLVADQRDDGGFGHEDQGNMYAHGQATIALCEAYALTRDPALRNPAQRAVDYIVTAQHSAGGWRYQPGQEGDLSVTGWELMALRSAQMAYLTVPEATLKRAWRFLDSVQTSSRVATFGYWQGAGETPPMTAEGMLSRQYGGWKGDHPPLLAGADYLLKRHLPSPNDVNIYYWYYATQAMHHIGGDRWQLWNKHLRTVLVELQEDAGHEAGSWTPEDRHDVTGGRLYMTALAVCTLEVYYRHMPLYRSGANAAQ